MISVCSIVFYICVQCSVVIAFSKLAQHENNLDDLDSTDAILSTQSTTCTAEDDVNRIQCFRELPLEEYEIFEGEDVQMTCRVAYQQGKLQWAFKGKMLGFDRNIPTHTRMRMPGNPAIGDHRLFIENVKVSDTGNYECQLSPSASQPPRRRMTKLTVLKVPSPPLIYQNGKSNKRNISVSIKKGEIDSVINLTCVSMYGNPVPTFKWSVNNHPLESGSKFRSSDVIKRQVDNDTSLLTIKSSQLLNGDIIKCTVSNKATEKKGTFLDNVISTEVRVFKRVLPGKIIIKEIIDNDNTVVVLEGGQLHLTCICSNPGDPPINLKWSINSDEISINSDWVSSSNNNILSQSVLKIPNINRKWHKKSFFCSGTQEDYPTDDSESVLVLINHSPSKLDLEAISMRTNSSLLNPSTVYCKEGQIVKLSCTSDLYYTDNLKIVWYIKNTDESDWQAVPKHSEQVVLNSNTRLKYMTSTLDVQPSLIDKDISNHILSRLLHQVVCIMKSTENHLEIRQQVKIEQFEQPNNPIISINDQQKSPILTNGESAKIKCSVTAGHPTPELYLLDERNQEIKTSSYNQMGVTKLEYNLEVKPRDNGKKFRCMVFYKYVLDFTPLVSEPMTLKVARPPDKLNMKLPNDMENLQENQFISLQCYTDSSFPEAKIEWRWYHSCKNSYLFGSRSMSMDNRSNCKIDTLNEHQMTVYHPSSQSTVSTLNIKLNPDFDLSSIECMIIPHEKWTTIGSLLSKSKHFRVKYAPTFSSKRKPNADILNYIVEEGQNFTILIKSRAHPSINGYTWFINKQPIERKSHIYLSVDKFSLVSAQPEMMANYTLLVENPMGKAAFDFFLNVTFAPKLLGPTKETMKVNPMVEYKHKVMIMCSAQANPFRKKSSVRWFRDIPKVLDQDELINILRGRKLYFSSELIHCAKDQWTEGNVSINCISLGDIEIVSSLQIQSTDYRYIGPYKCIFSNSIKQSSAIKTTNLVFPTHPIPIRNPRNSEVAFRMSGSSELNCYFISFPVPSVKWVNTYKNESIDNSVKYSTLVEEFQPGFIKAALTISDTNDFDLGRYTCVASNEYGEGTHSVSLVEPRTPTQPLNFTIINVTDTTISIGWILGFNGGSKQTIKLKWRLRDTREDHEYKTVQLPEEDKDVQFYTITNLHREREYEIMINSVNKYSKSQPAQKSVIIKTINYDSGSDSNHIQNDSKKVNNKITDNRIENSDSNNFLIIILLATVGLLLVSIKIGLIVFFIRKRKLRQRKSNEKISSPSNQHMIDTMGYLNNDDSMEMRAPSLIRSGIESNMYAQSLSDHLSQNGSDNGLKLNYYKTNSDDQFHQPYFGTELDLVASVMGRNQFEVNALPPNFHPAYIQLAESSSMTGAHEPFLAGYYTQRAYYNQQTPSRVPMRKSSHSSIDTAVLPQYPISSSYQRRMDKVPYPQSAVSISTTSGDSNCSQSPPRKYVGYSPLVNQSGAPSTVEEYLSSGNSASESHRFGMNGSDEYFTTHMSSFRLGHGAELLNQKEYYSSKPSAHQQTQESAQEMLTPRIIGGKEIPNNSYQIYNDHQRFSTTSDSEHLLKPPLDFSGEQIHAHGAPSQMNDTHKLNYVDLISHSSPSVIRFTGPISENL